MKIQDHASLTQAGSLRPFNEDGVRSWERPGIWAVSDGMGSTQEDKTASDLAFGLLDKALPLSDFDPTVALLAAHDAFIAAAPSDQSGLGASLVVLSAPPEGNLLTLSSIGDCRGYVLDAEGLTLRTTDHTQIQQWVDEGLVEPSAVRTHPYRNILTQALGIEQETPLQVSTWATRIDTPKRVLLCSDGLSDFLDEATLQSLLTDRTCREVVQALAAAALEAGSGDDLSLVVLDIVPDPQ